jgi:hypothetical protein
MGLRGSARRLLVLISVSKFCRMIQRAMPDRTISFGDPGSGFRNGF